MSNKKTVLCVLSTIGDTKDSKRVSILKQAGFNVIIGAYKRNNFISRSPERSTWLLGKIEDRKYFKRICVYVHSVFRLRKLVAKSDLIYATSPDLALISLISSFCLQKPLVMDIADIREIEVSKSILGKIVRSLDRFVVKRCDLIVVTSQAFIDSFYKKTLKLNIRNSYLLENKVDYNIPQKSEISLNYENNKKLRIGYFGVLRDNWTIELLTTLLSKYPNDYEVIIAGIDSISNYAIHDLNKQYANFHFLGPYHSPDDLNELYDKIDVMATFYPESEAKQNWFEAKKICRSNRFYEACYFRKPIMAFSFSEDGRYVEELGIGITFDNYNIQEAIEKITRVITKQQIKKWEENMQKLPIQTYKFTNESKELETKINDLLVKIKR